MSSIITLTTDFGVEDGYVGAMKGAVFATTGSTTIVDISHDIPPQNVAHAAYVLWTASSYFPPETVHVCIVDPDVGTSRRAISLEGPRGRFVGPDSGVFTHVLTGGPRRNDVEADGPTDEAGFLEPMAVRVPDGWRAYKLTNVEFWRPEVSNTFHGRDIFAPVAGHLASGVEARKLGPRLEEVTVLNLASPAAGETEIEGRVIHVDRFGNLITNVHASDVRPGPVEVAIGNAVISAISRNYAEGDGLVALVGSNGYLEVAARNGSAARELSAGVGASVTVSPSSTGARDAAGNLSQT